MTDDTPVYGCTIGGLPAMPILLSEHQQLVTRLAAAEAELRRSENARDHLRHRAEKAEADRDEARQHAAAIAAQRDRLRQRMNTLADRWDYALAVDKPYARTLRAEISVAPFDPEGAMVMQEYRERGRTLWAFRCWGTDTCDGWLGLGHHTQSSAKLEQERHVAEAHVEPGPAATEPAPLHAQIAAAIRNTPARYPDDIAAAVCRVRDHAMEQLAAAFRDCLAAFNGMRNSDGLGDVERWQARVTPREYETWQEAARTAGPGSAGPT